MRTRTIGIAVAFWALLAVPALGPAAEGGYIRRWLVAGGFRGDPAKLLTQPVPGDPATLAPSAGQAVGDDEKWIEHVSATGIIDLRSRDVGIPRPRNSVAAAVVYVHSPKMLSAKLLMGFEEGIAVYVNGVKAYENPRVEQRRMTPDAFRADVLLGKGWNRVYLKIARHKNPRALWGFAVRLVGRDLKPPGGLKFSTKNPYPFGKAKLPAYEPFINAYATEHFGTHRIRLANRTPIDLPDVRLLVRSRSGKVLMKAALGDLKGNGQVEADVEADEVFFQKHYAGAKAEVTYRGGKLSAALERVAVAGAAGIEYITPHVQRMQPWAGGRCRVLVITQKNSRQAVELAQRGDLEWHVVSGDEPRAAEKVRDELGLHKFDCILIGAQTHVRNEKWGWTDLPGTRELAKAIRSGVGLVYVNPTGLTRGMQLVMGASGGGGRGREAKLQKAAEHPIASGVPVDALPPIRPGGYTLAEGNTAVLTAGGQPVIGAFEKDGRRAVLLSFGRGAELIWRVRRPQDARLPVWERQWSLLLKAVVWAGKRQTGAVVSASVSPRLSRADLAGAKLTVSIGGEKAKAAHKLHAVFRSRGLTGHAVTADAAGQVALAIPPALAAGENEVDVTVQDAGGKVLGWATSVFRIRPEGSIGKIALAPEKDVYRPGETLTATVPGRADAAGLTLRAALADNRGRVVWRQQRPVKKGEFTETFTFPADGLLTKVGRLEVALAARGHVEARAETVFFVRRKFVWDNYEPVIWLTRGHVRWHYDVDYFRLLNDVMWVNNGWSAGFHPRGMAYDQMVHGGFDGVGKESLHCFSMNHNWMEATFGLRQKNFLKTRDVRWLYRTPIDRRTGKPMDRPDYSRLPFGDDPYNSYFPLDDPGYQEWTRRKIADKVRRVRRFDPISYDLMDEASYTSYARALDFDFSPVSLKHFRLWLQGQYGALAKLNAEWGTDFKKWDDVTPMHIHQVRNHAKGMKLPSYAPWVDHRKYNDLIFSRYVKLCSDAARTVDGDAHVGIGGGQRANPYGGWDYWLVTNHHTWIENYGTATKEYIRSFNTPDRRLKACPGSGVWYGLMHGCSGFYRWVDYGHLRNDFSLLARGKATARQLQAVRGRGFGKLFLKATPVDGPIAVHYSHPTVQLAYALARGDEHGGGVSANARLGAYHLLEEMGYQHKFVAYAQVETGELLKKPYQLMILPESIALSRAEAEQLKKFVQAGGVLLCDRETGEWTDHGRKRAKTVLEEYFGVDPARPAEKKLGKGWLVYLNSDFPSRYWSDRNSKPVGEYWKTMGAALAKAGLPAPRARVYSGAEPARRTEIRYYRLGRIAYRIVAAELPGTYRFKTASGGHLYDMRTGRHAGTTGAIEVPAEAGVPALVAVSPYKIESVAAAADKATVQPGQPVKITAKVQASEKPDLHALNFRVYAPEGAERRHYGDTLFGAGGATLTIPTALNEAAGKWTVKVTDLASGVTGEATFEVK